MRNLEMLIPIVAIVSPFLWGIIHSIASAAERTVKHSRDVELKMQMVQRGFSSLEIERVVSCGAHPIPDELACDEPPRKPAKAWPKYEA